MKTYRLSSYILILVLFIVMILAACQPQVVEVEVEVTREVGVIVTQETIVEVTREVETIVEVEVEVTRDVEVIVEEAIEEETLGESVESVTEEEAMADDADQSVEALEEEPAPQEAGGASPLPSAVGSEEDDGSPFTPTSLNKTGASNGDQSTTLAWLSSSEANIEEPIARVLLNHVEDMVIVHTIQTESIEEQVVLAKSILLYQRSAIASNELTPAEIEPELIYLPLSHNQWRPILSQVETDRSRLAMLSGFDLCSDCSEERSERLYILTPDRTFVLRMNVDQTVESLDLLLTLIRDLRGESQVRARTTLDSFE